MEVFPTPWSPKNTSLYFASGDILGPDVVTGAEAGALPPLDSGADIFDFLMVDAMNCQGWIECNKRHAGNFLQRNLRQYN